MNFENICFSWEESLLDDINRAEEAIIKNGIFSVEYVLKLKHIMPNFKEYFSSIKPEPFLDDITTKNVLIHEGKLSGIIDLDWISFGDEVLFLGLVTMALLSMNADLDYADYLKDEMKLNEKQERALKFYVLMFCVIFMSEKGMCFNQNEPMKVSEEEKALLTNIELNKQEITLLRTKIKEMEKLGKVTTTVTKNRLVYVMFPKNILSFFGQERN